MAAIDLRSTTIFIKDGSTSSLAGTITGDQVKGASVIPVAITGAVSVGQFIVLGSHMQFYTIIDHHETGGNTDSITILPHLIDDIPDTTAIDVVGNAIYAKIGEGNLTYDEKRNLVYIRDRGFIDTVKLGDEEPMDVSIDFTWEFLRGTASTPPTFEEAFKRIGQAASWVSTSVDSCEPYSVDVIILDIPPCGTDAEEIILPEFRWESISHDLKGAKVAAKGTCNVLMANVSHTTP